MGANEAREWRPRHELDGSALRDAPSSLLHSNRIPTGRNSRVCLLLGRNGTETMQPASCGYLLLGNGWLSLRIWTVHGEKVVRTRERASEIGMARSVQCRWQFLTDGAAVRSAGIKRAKRGQTSRITVLIGHRRGEATAPAVEEPARACQSPVTFSSPFPDPAAKSGVESAEDPPTLPYSSSLLPALGKTTWTFHTARPPTYEE